ncbi:phosphoadenosine phosphosulfate reductase domain-containing protein [Novosphingobium sp. MBES04]|uniref:phosphoadenosine phosphosulfate reductase domain-containing protein n=1 Tax=Novosphingobium sp. MBES04 TaxID=1206458 RepID=UPI00058071DC|nr:phosphoadenosine phosphosulfate reductase family protein [Novosphingobium sp. MBES04]
MSPQIESLIARGALFVINDSAGKDSQAQKIKVMSMVPHRQILIVHALLPEVEWDGTVEHIEANSGNIRIVYARARKTLFEMVEHRGMFPSPANRQCTSDLKRGPIEREIRRYLKAHPEFGGLVVNCLGMRAEESTGRARLTPFKLNAANSIAGREWYDWLPIHDWATSDVFACIAQAGQKPHWAYAAGMTRLSCCFCIMASQADLTTAAKLNPPLYRRYVETEQRLGFTLSMSRKALPEITGIAA